MIPTRLKAKLPRHLSYPIGAQAISEALDGSPHLESLSITFWDQAVSPASEFRRCVAERRPYRIMEAEFAPASSPGFMGSNRMIEDGWYEETWKLTVYPVLAEFRPLAHRLLLDEGLPAIAEWLKASDRVGWSRLWQQLKLVFDPTEPSLVRQDTHSV